MTVPVNDDDIPHRHHLKDSKLANHTDGGGESISSDSNMEQVKKQGHVRQLETSQKQPKGMGEKKKLAVKTMVIISALTLAVALALAQRFAPAIITTLGTYLSLAVKEVAKEFSALPLRDIVCDVMFFGRVDGLW